MRDLVITIGVLGAILAAWFGLNKEVLKIYPPDPSEGGKYVVLRWATDPNPARTEQIALFNRMYADKRVRLVLDPNPAEQAILTQAAAGAGPDIVDIYGLTPFRRYTEAGVLMRINDLMREAGLSMKDFWEKRRNCMAVERAGALPDADEYERYDIYAVPNNVTADVCFLNRSLYDAVARERQRRGEPMPPLPWNDWTWWDFVQLGQALTLKSEDGRSYKTFGADLAWAGFTNLIYQAGGRLYDEAGERVLLGSSEAAIACQFYFDLVRTFHILASPEDKAAQTGGGGWGGQTPVGLFSAGRLGMLTLGRWGLIKMRREAQFKIEIYPIPRYVPYEEWERWQRDPSIRADPRRRDGEWGEQNEQSRNRGKAAVLQGRVTGILKTSKYPREAFYFLEYLASPEFNHLINKDADAFSSRKELTVQYLSRPDPDFPEEDQHRAAILDSIEHTHEEEASAFASAAETSRLFWTMQTNLSDGQIKPTDPDAQLTYAGLGRTPSESVQTNPTVGRAAVEEFAPRMQKEIEKARKLAQGRSRDYVPDIAALLAVLLGGLVLTVRFLRKPPVIFPT